MQTKTLAQVCVCVYARSHYAPRSHTMPLAHTMHLVLTLCPSLLCPQAYKLQSMALARDAQQRTQRAQLAREAVDRDTPLPTAAEYAAEHTMARRKKEGVQDWRERLVGKRVTSGAQKEALTVWSERAKDAEAGAMGITEFEDYTMEIYAAIVNGRRYKKGECNTKSCSDRGKKCPLKCATPMAESHVHMPQHVRKLLSLV